MIIANQVKRCIYICISMIYSIAKMSRSTPVSRTCFVVARAIFTSYYIKLSGRHQILIWLPWLLAQFNIIYFETRLCPNPLNKTQILVFAICQVCDTTTHHFPARGFYYIVFPRDKQCGLGVCVFFLFFLLNRTVDCYRLKHTPFYLHYAGLGP